MLKRKGSEVFLNEKPVKVIKNLENGINQTEMQLKTKLSWSYIRDVLNALDGNVIEMKKEGRQRIIKINKKKMKNLKQGITKIENSFD